MKFNIIVKCLNIQDNKKLQVIKIQVCLFVYYIFLFGFLCLIGFFGLFIEVKVFFLRDIVYFVLNFIDEYNKFRISSKFFFDEIVFNVCF